MRVIRGNAMAALLYMTMAGVALLTSNGCGKKEEDDSEVDEETTSTSPYPKGYSTKADSKVALSFQGASGLSLAASSVDVYGKAGTVIGTLSLTTAQIVLEEIKFKMEGADEDSELALKDDDEDEDEDEEESSDDSEDFKFKDTYLVDLLTNTASPDPSNISVPAGTYKEIELKVKKVEEKDLEGLGIDSTNAIYENSIYVAGTYTPTGGSAVAFSMSYDLSEKFEISGSDGVDISKAGVNDFVIAFRLANWFRFDRSKLNSDNVDFSDLAAGAISLTKDADETAKKVREVIKELIKKSADFGKDEDEDGQLGNDEDAEDDDEDSEDGDE